MNKITKRLLALGLALSISVGAGGVSSFAGSNKYTGTLNGYKTLATYSIDKYGAKASTAYGGNGSAEVISNYSYVNMITLYSRSVTKRARNKKSATVNFSAPNQCYSIQMYNTHSVVSSGKSWEKTYLATY